MAHTELLIFGLLVAVAGLAVVARVVRVPYPIPLTIGGLALGFAPGVPDVALDPDVVLLLFLPPLLYSAAFFANLRELRANLRPITGLAVGLVAGTMAIVAVIGHEVIGLPWAAAFVLGAVVSPADAVAPAEILRRLSVPRRVITIVQGENLTNDWTALVAYKFAVAAVVTGSFSLWEAGPQFVFTGVGGIAIGVAVGVLIAAVRRRVDDPLTDITISLLTAYAAYLPAEEVGASGVIAAVTVGVWLGWQSSELTDPATRLQLFAIWEVLQFLLNAFLFVLIGLQLPGVIENLSGRSTGELIGYGALISATVIVVRIVWVFGFTYLPRRVRGRLAGETVHQPASETTLVAWSSMRGSVSLAAALAIPLTVDGGAPFPERDLIVFLAFCVILATLVGQGLLFPAVIRAVDIEDDTRDLDEELNARLEIAFAATDRIDEIEDEDWVYEGTADRVRNLYEYRQRRFRSQVGDPDHDDDEDYEARSDGYRRFMGEVLAAQRRRLRALRDQGEITDEVRRTIERDLDLEQARLDPS